MKTQKKDDAKLNNNHAFQMKALAAPNQGEATRDIRGFTLVELIVVIGIIGVLATLAIPSYSQLKNSAKIARAESEVRVIDKAVSAYLIDKNSLPNLLSEIGPEGSLIDPWGHLYVFNPTPTYKDWVDPLPFNNDYDLYSVGADGVTEPDNKLVAQPGHNNCSDDIIRAASGGTVVLGKNY